MRNELCFRHAPPEAACSQRVRAYAIRGISEDSIEVLSTTDSIINPEDLQAITEEDSEDQPTPYSSLDPEPPVLGAGGDEGANSFRDLMEQVTILRDERKEPRRNVRDRGKYLSLRIEGDSLHRGEGSAAQGDTGAGHSAGREPVREDVMPEITAMHQGKGECCLELYFPYRGNYIELKAHSCRPLWEKPRKCSTRIWLLMESLRMS